MHVGTTKPMHLLGFSIKAPDVGLNEQAWRDGRKWLKVAGRRRLL
jgi:hypothetical protein